MNKSLDPFLSSLYPDIVEYLRKANRTSDAIHPSRQLQLREVSMYLSEKIKEDKRGEILFVSSLNSSIGEMAHLWAIAAIFQAGMRSSIGSNLTGIVDHHFQRAAQEAMEDAGWKFELEKDKHHHLIVRYAETEPPVQCFRVDSEDQANNLDEFVTITVADHLHQRKLLGSRSELFVVLPYPGPGLDENPKEVNYAAVCYQMAAEMAFLMSDVQNVLSEL